MVPITMKEVASVIGSTQMQQYHITFSALHAGSMILLLHNAFLSYYYLIFYKNAKMFLSAHSLTLIKLVQNCPFPYFKYYISI